MSSTFTRIHKLNSNIQSTLSSATSTYFAQVMSIPSFLYVIIVVGFPTLYLIYLAVTVNVVSVIRPVEFVGLDNIIQVLAEPAFWRFFVHTLAYAASVVVGGLVIQLGIAISLNADLPYRRLWQALVLVPWGVPRVISSMMWKLMFNPNFGVINYVLIEIGLINSPIQWFSSQVSAFLTIVVTSIWGSTPLSVLILLAGLQTIPEEMYESARVDGAGAWARFRHVTLPMLRPALMTVIVLQTVLSLRGFEIIYALTGGGPGRSTTVIAIDIFNNLIRLGNVAYASAESLILVAIIIVVMLGLSKLLSRDEEVEV